MRNRKWIILIVSTMLLMLVAGCQEEEKDLGRFQELYVVGESNSLPYNDSWQQLNRDSKEE